MCDRVHHIYHHHYCSRRCFCVVLYISPIYWWVAVASCHKAKYVSIKGDCIYTKQRGSFFRDVDFTSFLSFSHLLLLVLTGNIEWTKRFRKYKRCFALIKPSVKWGRAILGRGRPFPPLSRFLSEGLSREASLDTLGFAAAQEGGGIPFSSHRLAGFPVR